MKSAIQVLWVASLVGGISLGLPALWPVGGGPSIGIAQAGTIAAWGRDDHNQVSDTPADEDFVVISAGGGHNLALRYDGSLAAWGWDASGQATVPAGTDYPVISAGNEHNLAIIDSGAVVAWGNQGQDRCAVPAGTDFVGVAGGYAFSLALRENGSVVAWGANDGSQVSNVPAGTDFVAVDAGDRYGLALRDDGSIAAWGTDGEDTDVVGNVPAGTYDAIAAGSHWAMALLGDGSIVAWGANNFGQCSNVPGDSGFIAISAGFGHGLALRADGSIAAWGWNQYGQTNVPDGPFIAIDAGDLHNMALRSDPITLWDADTGTPGAQDGDGFWRHGQSDWWDGSENVAWDDTKKSVAIFGNGNATVDPTVAVDTVVTARGIVFNDANGHKYTLSGGSINLVSEAPTIEANVDARITSSISGTAGLTKTGPGTLEVTGVNTYTGGVAVTGGTLVGNTVSLLGDVALSGGSNVTFDQGFDASYSGKITGDGSVRKTGAGTLEVTSTSHDYSGDLAVDAGKLLVMGSLPVNTTVIVGPGGTLGGTGWLGAIDLHGSVAPGASIGTLEANDDVTLGAGAAYEWEVDNLDGTTAGVDWDLLTTWFDLIVSATPADPFTIKVISLDALGDPGTADGTLEESDSFKIAQAFSVDGFSADAFTIDTSAFQNAMGGLEFVVAQRAGSLYLDADVVLDPATLVWTGATDDRWNIEETANWSEVGPPRQYSEGDHVIFDDTAAAAPLIDLTATVNPGSVLVNNDAVDFELGGAGSIAGSCGLTKNGAGMLTIATSNTYTGDTRINAGTVTVASDGALGASYVALGDTTGSSDASLLVAGAFTVDRNLTVQDDGSGSSTRTLGGTNTSGTAVFSGRITLERDLALTAAPGGAVRLTGALDNAGGNTLTKVGEGTVILDGIQTHGPGALLDILEGTVALNTDAGSASEAHLSISVTDAQLHFGSNQHLDALTIDDGGKVVLAGADVVVLKHLVIEALAAEPVASFLDLADSNLVVDYAPAGPSPIAQIDGWLRSGQNIEAGYWDGPGIHSSTAAGDPTGLTTLGVLDNADYGWPDLEGTPVDESSVLVKYAYYGDADLDGSTTGDDYFLWLAGFDAAREALAHGGEPTLSGWLYGDFDYSGDVTGDDYFLWLVAFDAARAGAAPLSGGAAAIPEPVSLSLLALGAALVGWQRRRTVAAP